MMVLSRYKGLIDKGRGTSGPGFRMSLVVERVAQTHGIGSRDILSPDRGPAHVTAARHEAYALCRALTDPGGEHYSYPRIGRFFDRDHTSIIHGVRAHARRLAEGRGVAA